MARISFEDFEFTSLYKGDKPAPWGGRPENWNHNIVTVYRGGRRCRFDFWPSTMSVGELASRRDVLGAFQCFVSDACCAESSFEDFCADFGYDTDSRRAYSTYCACKRSADKLHRLYAGDLAQLRDRVEDEISNAD